MEFTDKTILITGASSGIGRETARYLSSSGAKVVLVGRNENRLNRVAEEIKTAGSPTPLAIVADVVKDSKRIIDQTIAHFGKLDVLVNNAGINVEVSVMDANIDIYDQVFNTNVRSVIELCKWAVPHLEKTKGNIVNVSSICGMVPVYSSTFYSMSKAALDQFTKCASNEFGRKGIRVNSVNPGLIDTPIFETVGMSPKEIAKFIEENGKKYPVGRIGNVSDVSRCIAFLASDRAEFITGTLLRVDGGAVTSAAYWMQSFIVRCNCNCNSMTKRRKCLIQCNFAYVVGMWVSLQKYSQYKITTTKLQIVHNEYIRRMSIKYTLAIKILPNHIPDYFWFNLNVLWKFVVFFFLKYYLQFWVHSEQNITMTPDAKVLIKVFYFSLLFFYMSIYGVLFCKLFDVSIDHISKSKRFFRGIFD